MSIVTFLKQRSDAIIKYARELVVSAKINPHQTFTGDAYGTKEKCRFGRR
jgi:hypothetical protein